MKRLINHSPTLLRLVVVLLLSNLVLAAFLFFRGKKTVERAYKSNEQIEAEVKKELGLSAEQAAKFKALLSAHRDTLKILGAEWREAKEEYYSLLKDSVLNDSLLTARVDHIAYRQIAMDKKMFSHFKEVRSMLDDRQRPLYDSMVIRMMSRSAWSRKKESSERK